MEDTKIESWAWEERLTPILTWLPGVFVDLHVIERWMKLLFGSGNLNSGFLIMGYVKGGNARPGLGVNTPLCFITLLACDTSSLRCASWKFDEGGEKLAVCTRYVPVHISKLCVNTITIQWHRLLKTCGIISTKLDGKTPSSLIPGRRPLDQWSSIFLVMMTACWYDKLRPVTSSQY